LACSLIEIIFAVLSPFTSRSGFRPITARFGSSLLTSKHPLVLVEGHERQHYLTPQAALQWNAMKIAAANEGIELLLISGYRSVDRQREIIESKLRRGIDLNTILAVNAAPGFSQHHTGLALDIGTPTHPNLMKDFEKTAAFRWLTYNAANFGFAMPYTPKNPHGFIYEPWHWVLAKNDH
jgi:D-alanyl-D-alanine carboxypeptidase